MRATTCLEAGVLSYNLQRRRDETASSDDNSGGGLASDMSINVDASAVDEAAAATAQVKSSTTNTGLDHGEEDSGAPSSHQRACVHFIREYTVLIE